MRQACAMMLFDGGLPDECPKCGAAKGTGCPYDAERLASAGQSPKGEKPKALSAEHADAATPKAADAQPSPLTSETSRG